MVIAVFHTLIALIILANVYALPTVVTLTKKSLVMNKKIEETQGAFEGDILLPPPSKTRGLAAIGNSVRWSNGIVPYEIAPGYTAEQEAAIVSRMRKLESLTAINNVRCVQFPSKKSSDSYYITIRNGAGCSSYVGQNTGITMERTVSLNYPGCFDDGRTMHELLHALGFFHEQSRPDRDSYVTVNSQNIQTGMESQFTKYGNTVVDTLNSPYDYASVMHYEKTAFSSNSLPTIEPLQSNVKIGQRYKLSTIDIQEIRLFYNCSTIGTTLPPPTTPTAPTTPSANTSIYSSELTSNNPVYARTGGFGTNYYYETISVTVTMGGIYIFQCNSNLDSFASIYSSSFSPSNPALNLLFSFDDDSNDNWEFEFGLNFPSAYTIILVFTTYSPNVIGSFSIVATGPAKTTFIRTSNTVQPITTPTITTTKTTTTSRTTATTPTTTASRTTKTTPTTTTTKTTTTTTVRITATSPKTTTTMAAYGFVPINLFYPSDLGRGTCPSNSSWTIWFNVGQPNSTSGDREDMSIILAQNPTAMCHVPFSIEAQAINARTSGWSIQWQWSRPSSTLYLLSFQSFSPVGVDFHVRYCCPIGSFVASTTTTTTPSPLGSTTCGKQAITPRSQLMSRIVGGTEAIPNSWPWMIYYQEQKLCGTNTCYGVCGATLISENYVITAAHCIGTNNPSDITLIAGMHNRQSNTETEMRQQRTAQAIYIHPQYDGSAHINDIAVLRVTTPFTFTKYVQPACLPGGEPQPNDQVIIIGWGAQTFGGSVNDVLRQANTKIVGMCELWWPNVDSSRQVCVADSVSGNSACQGDSGGPILALYQGQYVVSGVTSYVRDCNTTGTGNAPNVYTRVSAYNAWIKGIIG